MHRLVERHPLHGHVELLVLDDEAVRPVGGREPLREVDQDLLVAEARGREVVRQQRPALRGEGRLLGELALRGGQRGLAVGVAQAGGQLPEVAADRVAVLADHHDPPLVVHRGDAHGADVPDDLPHAVPAAGHRDGLLDEGDDAALVHRLGGEGLVLPRPRRLDHQSSSPALVVLMAVDALPSGNLASSVTRSRPSLPRPAARAAARTRRSRSPPARTPRTAGAAGSGGS
jgi:hypothetical protein